MRVVFFGSSCFAVPALKAIIQSKHELVGVVTQPDKPTGRGMRLCETPIKQCAVCDEIPVYCPDKAKDPEFIKTLNSLKPDVLVVASYGQILSQATLDAAPLGGLNIHGSLLPRWRGASPIQTAILEGDDITGVTIMQMDKGMDTGDCCLTEAINIADDDNADTLTHKLAQIGAKLILKALDLAENGQLTRTPQDNSKAVYAKLLTSNDCRINWNEPAYRCRNRIRAFQPKPGCYAFLKGKRVKIHSAEIVEGYGSPGETLDIKDGIIVATGKQALKLVEVQPESKHRMTSVAFASGYHIKTGDLFE